MRGRLMQRFLAELRYVDTAATEDDPGYDQDFREPRRVANGQQAGARGRRESDPVRVQCQVNFDAFDELEQAPGGKLPLVAVELTFHFRDLEAAGLVDANGTAKIRTGDRLVKILTLSEVLVQEFADPPGAFVVHARPSGMGVSMASPTRNLLVVTCRSRDQGTASGP